MNRAGIRTAVGIHMPDNIVVNIKVTALGSAFPAALSSAKDTAKDGGNHGIGQAQEKASDKNHFYHCHILAPYLVALKPSPLVGEGRVRGKFSPSPNPSHQGRGKKTEYPYFFSGFLVSFVYFRKSL